MVCALLVCIGLLLQNCTATLDNSLIQLADDLTLLSKKLYYAELATREAQALYSLNFMWVNKGMQPLQRYIFPADTQEELQQKFLDNIYAWAKINPRGIVDIWYDSKFIPQAAINNTEELLQEHNQQYPTSAPIIIKDVRELPEVKKYPEVFSEKTPVYFRVDLLRAIEALVLLNRRATTYYFIYADLDMQPLSYEQLFDTQTLENLNKYGIVMARSSWFGYENGFQMLSNQNKNLLEALEWTIIELNIKRAQNALRGEFYNILYRKTRDPMEPLQQIIYDSYRFMFYYFFYLEKKGILTVNTDPQGKRPYDKIKDGLFPFGLDHYNNYGLDFTIDNKIISPDKLRHKLVPTKEVPLPPARLEYGS